MTQPDSADPALGETLYAEHCASCHGARLEGQPNWRQPGEDGVLPAPPHDETGHTWHHGDGVLFTYTKLGGQEALRRRGVTDFASGMPAFEDVLSDQEIWHVLAYIKSQWDPQVREMQKERTAMEQAGQ
ncbi:cytochrome c [Psychromarinibacter sp. C21-152]|uniref:Cytochrome c n=2 Tax=Psychromarinibacter sediminicola TaxID=3033385 RepID=A0AAE3NP34_9RHOB|nr:cytochrome c [Psychromarinibacter sediminicola]MDF0599397.1 cytochrome c [Psychromarinibacter sediminicola]